MTTAPLSFLDQMEQTAEEAQELMQSRSNGVVTKVSLSFGWHGIINKALFEEKGQPYDYKLSWVEVTNKTTSADAQKASRKIMQDMGSKSPPKAGMRVWMSRADVLGFDATANSDAEYYRDDIVYKPDQVQIDGVWTDIHEGYDEMMKSLNPYRDRIQGGKPFWAHVITFPVSHDGKYVKDHKGDTMTVPYFMAVFKSKQEATRYQERLDNGEIELPKWAANAEEAEGSVEVTNIDLSEKAQESYTPASFLKTAHAILSSIAKSVKNGDESDAAIKKAENVFECKHADIMQVLMLDEFESYRERIFASDEEPV